MILDSKEKIEYYSNLGCYANITLNSALKETVRNHPEKLALVDPSNKEALVGLKPDRYTYKQLDKAIDSLASGFSILVSGKMILSLYN